MNTRALAIGELAREAGVNVQTVRYYERRGLLEEPPRRASGYREYQESDVRRLSFIRRAQALGFTLTEIDVYLRTLLIHGACSALTAAQVRQRAGKTLSRMQQWAVEKAAQRHTNPVAVALANKRARIAWAVWKHERSYDGDHHSAPPVIAAAA